MEATGYQLRFLRDHFSLPTMNRILFRHSRSFETIDSERILSDQAWHALGAVEMCCLNPTRPGLCSGGGK